MKYIEVRNSSGILKREPLLAPWDEGGCNPPGAAQFTTSLRGESDLYDSIIRTMLEATTSAAFLRLINDLAVYINIYIFTYIYIYM